MTSQHPKIAIVILNWNGEDQLRLFLPSVIKHSASENVTIVVADNGSTDASINILTSQFPEAEIIRLDENYGFAEGYNKALEQVDADYFVLLNSDVEVTPNWISPVIEQMESDETVAACQPKVLSWNDKQKFEHAGAAGGFIDKHGYPLCRGRMLNHNEVDSGQYDDPIEIFWATGACFFIRAGLFKKFGGFESSFWAHMEEIDLCWRMKNQGYKIMCIPQSKVYHFGGATLSYQSPMKIYLNFRNNLFMLYRNLPRNGFFKNLFFRLILDGVAATVFLAHGKPSYFYAVLKAHFHFYRALPRLRAKRKTLLTCVKQDRHPQMINKGLVWNFFFRKKKTFTDLTA